MKISVQHSECQLLFLNASQGNHVGLDAITSISAEFNLPLLVCNSLIVDASCLQEIDGKLVSHSGDKCRPRLLLAGSFLEEQVTICALHNLYLGFEVFLLKDFVITKDRTHEQVYDTRLIQAGVVPTTLRQLLYEWMTGEDRAESRMRMGELLALIENKF